MSPPAQPNFCSSKDPVPDYFSVSTRTASLRADITVLRELEMLVREGIAAIPKRGLEVGGLLFGTASGGIQVDAIQAVPIEYRDGPSYQLSPADIETLRQTIDGLIRPTGPGLIGYFRSHTKGELEIRAADLMVAGMLGVHKPLVLLIRASASEPSVATLYRAQDRDWAALLEFPLVRRAGNGLPAMPAQTSPAPAPEPAASVQKERLAAAPKARQRRWIVPAGAGLIACAMGAVVFVLSPPPRASITAQPLGLQVRAGQQGLAVSWNKSSTPVRNGISGVLMIEDGARRRQLQLSPGQLRAGGVLYSPENPLVQFKLEVYSDRDHFTGETVRFETSPHALNKPPVATFLQRAVGKLTGRKPEIRVTRRRADTETAKTILPAEIPKPEPILIPPPPGAVRSPEAIIAEPPNLTSSASLPPLSIPPPRVHAPSSEISYTAAIPRRRISPAAPVNLRSAIRGNVSVEVKVAIDSDGKVTRAALRDARSPAQKLLAPHATQAALLWRFEPARRNGQPIDSEAILRFEFAR